MRTPYKLTFFTLYNGWREFQFKTSYSKSPEQYYHEIITYFDKSAIGKLILNNQIDYTLSNTKSSIIVNLTEDEYLMCQFALENNMELKKL